MKFLKVIISEGDLKGIFVKLYMTGGTTSLPHRSMDDIRKNPI